MNENTFNLEELQMLRICVQNQIEMTNLYYKKMKKKKNTISNTKDEQILFLKALDLKLGTLIFNIEGEDIK